MKLYRDIAVNSATRSHEKTGRKRKAEDEARAGDPKRASIDCEAT